MYVLRNNKACSRNNSCRGKAISFTYSECVSVALVIQYVTHMLHITLSSVAHLTLPYFATRSHKRHDFRKKWLKIKWVFWVWHRLSETFIILRRIQRDFIISHYKKNSEGFYRKLHSLHVKYPLSLSNFIETWNFMTNFRKILENQISRKSVKWESNSSMRMKGRTF